MKETKTFRVYGQDGRRQRLSFAPSVRFDWSEDGAVRILDVRNSDKTGTNDYTEIEITTDRRSPESELMAQIEDGIFEDSKTGKIVEVADGKEVEFRYPY